MIVRDRVRGRVRIILRRVYLVARAHVLRGRARCVLLEQRRLLPLEGRDGAQPRVEQRRPVLLWCQLTVPPVVDGGGAREYPVAGGLGKGLGLG